MTPTPYIPKPIPVRAGSEDFLKLSSDGKPRKPPIIMSSKVSGAPLGR